jgi:hypothetical protein
MHIRREIDNLLDQMNDLIVKNKESNKLSSKDKAKLQEIRVQINIKTNNGKYAKGMWTESPEFVN